MHGEDRTLRALVPKRPPSFIVVCSAILNVSVSKSVYVCTYDYAPHTQIYPFRNARIDVDSGKARGRPTRVRLSIKKTCLPLIAAYLHAKIVRCGLDRPAFTPYLHPFTRVDSVASRTPPTPSLRPLPSPTHYSIPLISRSMLALQAPPSAFIRFSGQHAVYHPRIRLIRKKSLLPLQAGPSERDDPMPPPPAEGSPEAPPPIPTPGVLPGYESVTASMSEAMPPMCARYSVELKKPLGLVLEESTTGGVREIYVAKVRGRSLAVVAGRGRRGREGKGGREGGREIRAETNLLLRLPYPCCHILDYSRWQCGEVDGRGRHPGRRYSHLHLGVDNHGGSGTITIRHGSGVGQRRGLRRLTCLFVNPPQIYGETVVRSGEKRIVVNTRGESFDTIMAGIGSHKAGQSVTLELQRCVSAAF